MDIRKAIKRSVTAGALIIMVAAVQFFVSCGSEDYKKPSTTQTDTALISAATLSAWMDAGKVNGTGYDRVVILDVTSDTTYSAGHIPGALFVDSREIVQDRNEGVGVSTYMVLDGYKMDELIQRYGIDGNTTVVFTSQSTLFIPSRAYFTFRYWGFPKNRLKVLNGLNPAWSADYALDSGPPPVVARSSHSVRDNGALRDDLRGSLAEMIDYAEGRLPNAVAIDVRGSAGSYSGTPGKTPGMFSPDGDNVVFEGRIKGAEAISGGSLLSGQSFKSVDVLISTFTSIGLDSTKTAYVYCTKGYSSSATFFILDGILGWPAAVYDGSWGQWGQLSGEAAAMGQLAANSPWRTDIPSRSYLYKYNYEPVISAVTFSGTGTNDLVTGNLYSSGTTSTFRVEIDSVGTPNTFRWSGDGGSTWTTGIAITGSAQDLVSTLTVSFASTTNHSMSDTWTFTATARKNVEQFTADGSACSATYNANGTITNSSSGATACANSPNSYDTDVNRIEEADKDYMQSGGSGGSSSGGTSVPAGC